MNTPKKPALILLLTLLCATAFAQIEISIPGADGETAFTFRADTPDPAIKQMPKEIAAKRQSAPNEFIRLLADYINEKSENDYDRVKKAHDWVALNIRYDVQSFFSGRHLSQSPDSVIKRGTAVCAGYSGAFGMICDALEIGCVTVSGHGQGYGSGLFKSENVALSNHAWNIVTIEEKKYQIDTTWDSGYLNGSAFQAEYTTDYLFIDPDVFIYRHFPGEDADQLLDPPLSAEEFSLLPLLRPRFFQVLESWPDLPRITEINAGEVLKFEFSTIPEYELIYGWYTQTGTKVGIDVFSGKKDVYTISPPKLKPGKYALRLWAQKSGSKQYISLGEFGFLVK